MCKDQLYEAGNLQPIIGTIMFVLDDSWIVESTPTPEKSNHNMPPK